MQYNPLYYNRIDVYNTIDMAKHTFLSLGQLGVPSGRAMGDG